MLKGLTPPSEEPLCAMMKRAAELDKADLEILLGALADPRWSGAALATELNQRGFKVHRDLLNQHRTGKCRCAR